MRIHAVGENAVITRRAHIGSDQKHGDRELAGEDMATGELLKPKPAANVQDEGCGPDQFASPDNSKDVAKQKKVAGGDGQHPPQRILPAPQKTGGGGKYRKRKNVLGRKPESPGALSGLGFIHKIWSG